MHCQVAFFKLDFEWRQGANLKSHITPCSHFRGNGDRILIGSDHPHICGLICFILFMFFNLLPILGEIEADRGVMFYFLQ